MLSLEELEERKRKLKLQREIAWLEREAEGLAFLKRSWRWALCVGIPVLLALLGMIYFVGSFSIYGADAIAVRVGGAVLVIAAVALRWFVRRGAARASQEG